jgi:hypothetical protein
MSSIRRMSLEGTSVLSHTTHISDGVNFTSRTILLGFGWDVVQLHIILFVLRWATMCR